MQCFACENEGTQRCPRCGNAYCDDHGADFCDNCLDPMRAAPSRSLYRVALFGLFGGAVLTLWLLIRPPSVPGEGTTILNEPTATPALTPAGAGGSATPAPSGGASATPAPSGATEAPTATAAPTEAPTPTLAPTPTPGPVQYTVVDGDTWYGVAEAFGVDANALAAANGRTLDEYLHPGETLIIPQ